MVVYNDGDYNNADDDGNGNNIAPFDDFDVSRCDTYENLWMWDLSLSCDDYDNFNNCECTFTEELIAYGYLTCSDMAYCPSDCQVCRKCLQIVGCPSTTNVGGVTISSDDLSFYIIAVAVGVIAVVAVTYTKVRQCGDPDKRGDNLIVNEHGAGSEGSTEWMTPTDFPDLLPPQERNGCIGIVPIALVPLPTHGDTELSTEEDTQKVWLAPMKI